MSNRSELERLACTCGSGLPAYEGKCPSCYAHGPRAMFAALDRERIDGPARVRPAAVQRQIDAVWEHHKATRELVATLRATLAGIASCSTCEVCREAARRAHALADAWQ